MIDDDAVGTLDGGEALDARTGDASSPTSDSGGPGLDFAALREGHRGPDGRWQKGAMPRVKHGLRMAPDHPALAPLLVARESAILVDLGHDLSAVEAGIVKELARVMLLVEAAGEALIACGLLTGKGSARAMVGVYQSLLDRQVKLASMVGAEPAPEAGARPARLRGEVSHRGHEVTLPPFPTFCSEVLGLDTSTRQGVLAFMGALDGDPLTDAQVALVETHTGRPYEPRPGGYPQGILQAGRQGGKSEARSAPG